jgi:cold shock CspA family protein
MNPSFLSRAGRWAIYTISRLVALAAPFVIAYQGALLGTGDSFPANYIAGTLIQLNDNGAWSWFMDPRVIVDGGKLIVGSVRAIGTFQSGAADPREQGCTGRTDKMTGIVTKIDAQGFGIIDGADGCKVPFIPSDVMNHHALEPGQKVIFSVRRVKDQAFAENVVVMRDKQFRGLESA